MLQEKKFRRAGGMGDFPRGHAVLLLATNRNLSKLVSEREFREDLYYRVSVIPLEIAPFRASARKTFAAWPSISSKNSMSRRQLSIPRISHEAMRCLLGGATDWRGNVRELENTIERV